MKVSKERLLELLELVQNKLKNDVVISTLKKYVNDEIFNTFKNSLELYTNSIDNIYSIKNEDSLNRLSGSLESFLNNTESANRIDVYHVKIIDSMNLIIDSVSKYERKGFEDKHDYFMDRMTTKTIFSENNLLTFLVHQLEEEGMPFSNYSFSLNMIIKSFPNSDSEEIRKVFKKCISHELIKQETMGSFENASFLMTEKGFNKANLLISNSQDNEINQDKSVLDEKDIEEDEFIKRYNKLISLLISNENSSSNLILETFKEAKEFSVFKNSKGSIVIKAGQEKAFMNITLTHLLDIKYNGKESRYESYTSVIIKEIIENTIFDKIIESRESRISENINIGKELEDKFYNYLLENKFAKESIVRNKRISKRIELDISIELNNEIFAAIEVKGSRKVKNYNFTQALKDLLFRTKEILLIQEKVPRIFLVLFDINTTAFDVYEFDSNKNQLNKINRIPDFNTLTNQSKPSSEDVVTSYKAQNDAVPSFNKANPHIDDKDSLNIDYDVDAFSKLIAYKSLETPLSIGLFGKWGSGKSFFMNKLEKRITELSNDENTDSFCKNVVHVKFNAWHYSDANLLASLVYNIFDAIDEDINDEKNKGKFNQEEQKKLIYKELESTTKLLEQKSQKRDELELLVKNKAKEIENKKQEIENNSSSLTSKDVIDITKSILESPELEEDINLLKKEFPKEIYTNLNDFKNTYKELNSFSSLLFKSITKLTQSSKKDLVIYSFFIIVSIGLYYLLKNTNFINEMTTKLISFSLYFVPIIPFMKNIISNFKKLKPLIDNAKNVIDKWDSIKEKKLIEQKKDIELEKSRLNTLKNELHELDLEINKTNIEKEILDREIADIEDGKYFRDFVSEKVDSEDYKKHLGLVSLIRNNFTALEEFLPETDKNKKYKVDRIILYIDDLDRCSNKLVADVLESVHLLLAFKLFVVVVGIDLRWIKGALDDKYSCLSDDNTKITSEQYIEKIFQIPFKIKSLDNGDKQNLIKHLLEDDIIDLNNSDENESLEEPEIQMAEENKTIEIEDIKEKSKDIKIEKVEVSHEMIKLTPEEAKLIEDIADSIGDTPRTITRFINVYRIIRSHKYINNIINDYSEDYKMLIFLLSETFHQEGNKKLEEILSEDENEYYNSFNSDKKVLLQNFIDRFSFKI